MPCPRSQPSLRSSSTSLRSWLPRYRPPGSKLEIMKTAELISVEEYLHTTYDPDCDYVDGEVQERNLGERDHSVTQGEAYFYFRLRQAEWKVFVFPEQRVQVTPTRYRVPDVCVY